MSERLSGLRRLAEVIVTSTASDEEQPFTGGDQGIAVVVEKVLTIWRGGLRDDPGSSMNVEFDMADQS